MCLVTYCQRTLSKYSFSKYERVSHFENGSWSCFTENANKFEMYHWSFLALSVNYSYFYFEIPILPRSLLKNNNNNNKYHDSSSTATSFFFVRDILDILAQYNRLKSTLACTSSLGFSRLYILMLGFIVTQVIVLHSYTIKMQLLRDSSVDIGRQG